MATTKTLTPTNQTISIPELSDSPDMSVPADAISKEADAINSLNSKIETHNEGSGKDLNNYTTPGWYRFSNSVTNSPYGNNGLLYVETYGTTGIGRQIWLPDGSDSIYVRRLYGSFQSWQELALKSDIATTKAQYTPLVGYVPSSLAPRNFYVYDSKKCDVHFCIGLSANISGDSAIMQLPTVARGKTTQYGVFTEITTGTSYAVYSSGDNLYIANAVPSGANTYLAGTFTMSIE